jgi:Tol biopolymer transport system component
LAFGSGSPDITPDGRYVAFYSLATNLVPGVTNAGEIYVRDAVAGTTTWASAGALPALQLAQNATNAFSFGPSISTNGQFVTYEAFAYNTFAIPFTTSPGAGAILRFNSNSGLTDTINTNAALLDNSAEDAHNPVMTPDGRFVAFIANTNGGPDNCVLVWDAQTGNSVLASGDLTGNVPTNSMCNWPTITPDGRSVAFLTTATNLVNNPLTGDFHLYVRDVQATTTTLVDLGTNGDGSGVSPMGQPSLSADGNVIAFEAPDGSLVPGDVNKANDVFVRDLTNGTTDLISQHDPALASVGGVGVNTLSTCSVSQEGGFVAFVSEAENLVSNDTNANRDVFVRDLLGDTTLLVSADLSDTTSGNGMSYNPAISGGGRYVAFASTATNLVAGDTNEVMDVFVRDLLTGTTELVSVNTNGFSGNGASYSPMISADGQAVLFHSLAGDLAPGSVRSGIQNIFWRDLWSGTTYALSAYTSTANPVPPATMTPSGRFVVIGSDASYWYVWDSQSLALVSSNYTHFGSDTAGVWTSPDGNQVVLSTAIRPLYLYLMNRTTGSNVLFGTIRSSSLTSPCFSANSRFLAYSTASNNLTANTNTFADVYLYDCQTSSNVLVSQAFNSPASANGDSDLPAISPDGRFVAYRSAASNLVPNDNNGVPDVFLWDRLTGTTLLLSVNRSLSSSADNRSLTPVFSGDGSMIFFESWASDLVTNNCNRGSDLFAFNLSASSPIPLFQAAIFPGAAPGQGAWITWPVISGKSYQVQFKNDLSDAFWQTLSGSVTIVGNQGYLYDLAPGASQRFYRIVAQ